MKYKATIILPCYNKEKYIDRSLNSIISLSRFEDFEVILVDDCSTDNTVSIIEKYTEKYDNIVLYKLDKGSGSPSKPRNIGIKKSTAPYVIFMDPDDQIINDGYSVLLTKMEEYKSDILIGTRIGVNGYGRKVWTDFISDKYTYVNSNDYGIKLDLLNRPPFILKTIYKKDLILDNNIKFNEKITTSEDESFDIQCLAYAKKVTKINDIVYQYTAEAEGSITTSVSLRIYNDLYNVMEELTKSYSLIFSDEIIVERLMNLIDVFYLKKLAFFEKTEDIELACDTIYDSLEKYGFDKFDKLVSRKNINLINDIKNKKFGKYINKYFLGRINDMKKQITTLDKKNRKNEKLLKRKIVRMSIACVKIIQVFKKQILKGRLLKKLIRKLRPKKKTKEEKQYQNYVDQYMDFYNNVDDVCNDYWVFMDRRNDAKDNGEALYRYVMNNKIHDKIAYILSKESIDYARLKEEGFNVIDYDSLDHWSILKNCKYLFTSHCDDLNIYPWYYYGRNRQKGLCNNYPVKALFKLIFLQHGVTKEDQSAWLGGKNYYKLLTASPYERHSMISIPTYKLSENEVVLTGFPRWDYLKDESKNIVTIFPTWRKEITFSKTDEEFEERLLNSAFYKNWVSFFNSECVKKLSKECQVQFVTHHDNMKTIEFFKDKMPKNIKIVSYDDVESFTVLINTSKMLVTDHSSLAFDFLYLNKPVIYFDFDGFAEVNNVLNMEYYKFGYYCKTMDSVNQSLNEVMNNKFRLDQKRLNNINKLFKYRDSNNCKRVIDMIIKSEKQD